MRVPSFGTYKTRNTVLVLTCPNELTNLSALQALFVTNNSLGGAIPVDLGQMKELRYLDASTNQISGTIPPSIGGCRELQELRMSQNRITGDIPPQIGNIWGLTELRFDDNALTANFSNGNGAAAIGNLGRLLTLDLYNNKMVGDLPDSIQNLTSLQYMYVQNEHLLPLRRKFCGQRIPNNGKYNWRIVRDEYHQMMGLHCPEGVIHDTAFTFNSLQASGVFDSE